MLKLIGKVLIEYFLKITKPYTFKTPLNILIIH